MAGQHRDHVSAMRLFSTSRSLKPLMLVSRGGCFSKPTRPGWPIPPLPDFVDPRSMPLLPASRLSSASMLPTFSSLTPATKLSKPRQKASTFLAERIRACSVPAAQCGNNDGELHEHAQYKPPTTALPFTLPRFPTLQSSFPVDEDDLPLTSLKPPNFSHCAR